MDYWEWMTAIMVVLVLANLIRMNMFMMELTKKVNHLYENKIQEQQMKEDIMKHIQMKLASVDEAANAAAIHDWDYGGE